jgi:hypothetical protein
VTAPHDTPWRPVFQVNKVYKLAKYRKKTKNQWARDDPAFCLVQVRHLKALAVCPPHGKSQVGMHRTSKVSVTRQPLLQRSSDSP